MGMQSFRGAGGGGAFSTPVGRIDSDPFGEYELAQLATQSPVENAKPRVTDPLEQRDGLANLAA
jgi:hypothetical protein